MSLNRIILQGRLTREPEKRFTNSGISVTSFSIAVERDFKSDSGNSRETDFIDVVCFKGLAETVEKWFTKGQMAIVSGRLQIRQYQAKDGTNRRVAEVLADSVYFGESKKDRQEPAPQFAPPSYAPPQFPQQAPGQFVPMDDDQEELPF